MYIAKNLGSFLLAAAVVISAALVSCTQDEGYKNQNKNKQTAADTKTDSSIIREGEIDLIAIDQNKDGKVFQDPMDWNVISDVAGRCPICKMKLKEVTLEVAKENLIKNDFKVKDN